MGLNVIKGLIIGATMTVPGASGGTMAMILGIYESLLSAVTDFFKAPKEYGGLLLEVTLGGLIGLFCVSDWIRGWILFYPEESACFFEGCMAGGTLELWIKGLKGPKKGFWKRLLLFVPGIGFGILKMYYPICFYGEGAVYRFLMGAILALALILPGISVSASLYMMGLYQLFFEALQEFDWGFLLPIVLGGLLGGFITARLLKKALEKYPRGCSCLIAGFLTASLAAGLTLWQRDEAIKNEIIWLLAGILAINVPVIYRFIKKVGRDTDHDNTQSPAQG